MMTAAIVEYVDPHTGDPIRSTVTVLEDRGNALLVETAKGNRWWANVERVVAYPLMGGAR